MTDALLAFVWFATGNVFQIALRDGHETWLGFITCLMFAIVVTAIKATR